jgi:hypothetical protein
MHRLYYNGSEHHHPNKMRLQKLESTVMAIVGSMWEIYLTLQDGAPGHSAEYTINELRERGIYPIFWPPFSPDLNPIEAVWNRMKDYIEHHPDLPAGKQRTYDQLRQIVQEAWNAVSDQTLSSLIESMKERCEAVIAAEGGHTKY